MIFEVRPTVKAIACRAADAANVSCETILGRSAMPSHARARFAAIYVARECCRYSLNQIGRRFDGRDHSTIAHAVRRAREIADQDPEFLELIRSIQP